MSTLRRCIPKGLTTVLVVFSVVLLSVPAFAGPIVYTQPPQSPVVSTRASQDQSGLGLLFQTFDNFSLAQNAFIEDVLWQGSYFNIAVVNGAFNPPANATGFGVAFYGDSAGTPGSLLSTYTFSPAGAGQSFVAQQAFNAALGLGIYNYAATLTSPFLAIAGTPYWLSIYAFSPLPSPTEAQWGWNGGTGGNGSSFQIAQGVGGSVNFDRAFSLTGTLTPIPEPTTLLLLGGGVATLVARSRARRLTEKAKAQPQ